MMRMVLVLLGSVALAACGGPTSGAPQGSGLISGSFVGDTRWGLPAGGGAGPGPSMFDQNRPQPMGQGGPRLRDQFRN